MGISAKILLDSIGPTGRRLTTWELTYPRFIHSELMTHRMFSRNAASSRAIPIQKMISAVYNDPAVPVWWGKNQPGMQAKAELSGWRLKLAKRLWLLARYPAIVVAWLMLKVGLHKQIANRLLEPWLHITVVLSATEYENFFKLRAHPDAQPEFQALAYLMKERYETSVPRKANPADWHLPFIDGDDVFAACRWLDDKFGPGVTWTRGALDNLLLKMSVARCARVSYVLHDLKKTIDDDISLHDRLMSSGHWSPFEHVAQCTTTEQPCGNFVGWNQYRKYFSEESGKNLERGQAS